jgi:hypothetical protein
MAAKRALGLIASFLTSSHDENFAAVSLTVSIPELLTEK